MSKITLHINLEENPEYSNIFKILEKGKLRPEILLLIEDAIAKYFAAPETVAKITVKENNEHFTCTVTGSVEHLREHWQ